MKVFGIGLNKTGTTSLGKALEKLGFENHQSYNLDLTKDWSEGRMDRIIALAKENNNFEDWPWPMVYKELFHEFNDAKFILTIRKSTETWYQSLCKHSLITGPTEFRKLIYGYYMPHDFKKEHFDFYDNHNQNVINFFKENAPEKLIVICFENGDGWKKVCSFLDKEIPKTNFPYLNQNKNNLENNSFKNRIKRKIYKIIKRKD